MATRQVIISDLSGEDVPEDQHVKLVILEHPALDGGTAELDISAAEAEKFQSGSIELVHAEVHAPDQPRRQVVMQLSAFNDLFKDVSMNEVVNGARRSSVRPVPSRGRRSESTRKTKTDAEKRDYSSPHWAGVEHRGRTTEAEADFVRNNLDAANSNRAREGQDPIDPANEKHRTRYGLK